MKFNVEKSGLQGRVRIPASKSHTIRAVYIASLGDGESRINSPLNSEDTASALRVCREFGAEAINDGAGLTIKGFGGTPGKPSEIIDVGNSGTSLRIGLAVAALGEHTAEFTGDEQIQQRPMQPLLTALNKLGAYTHSINETGMVPIQVQGPLQGGRTDLDAITSQFLTALLIAAPVAKNDCEIDVIRLNEKPYVDITLWWLDRYGITYENQGYGKFLINGGQSYEPKEVSISADFSSATFFIVMGALPGNSITFTNLDMNDPQGDKKVLGIMDEMGADVHIKDNEVTVSGNDLSGMEIDMNEIPDALPALSVAGCFARGETRLVNVEQARLKETDRIEVMCRELAKMGADVEELENGLIIRQSDLKGTKLNGYGDHRVVMALACAGLGAEGSTVIDTAEAVNITFPDFKDLVETCGGRIKALN